MVPQNRSNFFVIIVTLLVLQIIDVSWSNEFDMCTNGTESGNSVFFTRTNNGTTNCHCTVNATNTKITFNTTIEPTGCGLKLAVEYNSSTQYYNCESYNKIFHTLSNNEEIKVRLVPGTIVKDGFEFGFNIESEPTESKFTISCYGLPDPLTTPAFIVTTLQTDTSPPPTTSRSTEKPALTESSTASTESLTESTESPIPSDTSSTPYIASTSRKTQKPKTSPQSSLPGIVGGFVTAIVVIVILIIIVVCILKKRKYKLKTTSPAPDKNNYYFQLEIPNDNADNEIVDHTYDNSSNTPTPKTNENTPAAGIRYDNIVISDNDLYVSSDAVENDLLSNAPQSKTPDSNPAEITNLVITDNDMYVSSGDIEGGTLPDTQVPKPTMPDDPHYQSIDSLDQTSDQSNVMDAPRPEEKNNKPLEASKLSFEPEYTTVNKAQKPQDSAKTNGDNSNANEGGSTHIKDNSKGDGDTSNSNDETSNSNGDTPISNRDTQKPNVDTPNFKGVAPNSNGHAPNSNKDNSDPKGDTLGSNSESKRDNSNRKDLNTTEDISNLKGDNSDTQTNNEEQFTIGTEQDGYTINC